jgi:hypothetical protein
MKSAVIAKRLMEGGNRIKILLAECLLLLRGAERMNLEILLGVVDDQLRGCEAERS